MALADLGIQKGEETKEVTYYIRNAQLKMTSAQLADKRPFTVTNQQIFDAFSNKQQAQYEDVIQES